MRCSFQKIGFIMSASIALLGFQVAFWSAVPALASAQVCSATLLEIQVLERVTTSSDRFRFSLRLQAVAPTKSAAMALLNQRLGRSRQESRPFVLDALTLPAPRSYSYGSGNSSSPKLERAMTLIGGEVSRNNYDALIQLAGRLLGVRLQDMTAIIFSSSGVALDESVAETGLTTRASPRELRS